MDRGIYASAFDAFTNYMNILGDFINRVNNLYPEDIDNEELESLLTTIRNQGDEIELKDKEIVRLQAKIEKIEAASEKLREQVEANTAKKAAPKAKAAAKPKAAAKAKAVKAKEEKPKAEK